MTLPYHAGMPLEVRGERWTLSEVRHYDRCIVLTLDGAEPRNQARSLCVVDPFDRPHLMADHALHRRPRAAVIRAVLGAIASARTPSGLWAARTAAIDVLPYQLEPALAVIGGATRLLLADAAGLGKTIQAALVIAELRARGWIDRALVVCPSGLRDTWAHELDTRFRLRAAVIDQAALLERAAVLQPGVNPWLNDAIQIASIDFIKRPEVLAALDQVPIDLLIADEAHHLAPGTDRGAAVSRLASRTPWVMLLSATPHSGDAAAYTYLTGIGAQRDAIEIVRRTRADVGLDRVRRERTVGVGATGEERRLFEAIDTYVRAMWRARGAADPAVRLVAITIARRAASSTAALDRTLARRLELLTGSTPVPLQPTLPWDEIDDTDDLEGDGLLGVRGLEDDQEERVALQHLLSLSRCCATGSKMRRLQRLLDAIHEPAIVFTEYRDTLDAIVSNAPRTRKVGAIHGGLPIHQRRQVIDDFNGGRLDTLVATDAAGEGLNLHHRCRLVIDVELPWNPLRLEQRAGRVDRIGQRRPVHLVHLFHPCTIEARVLEHLERRRSRAGAALDWWPTEADIAAAVFDGRGVHAPAAPLVRRNASPAALAEADRLNRCRRAFALGATTHTRCWSCAGGATRVMVAHRVTCENAHHGVTGDHVVVRRVELPHPPRNRREWRHAIRRLWFDLPLRVDDPAPPNIAAFESRMARIRHEVSQQRRVAHQRSLFDSRAEVAAAARDCRLATLDASLARISTAVSDLRSAHRRVELIAVWTER